MYYLWFFDFSLWDTYIFYPDFKFQKFLQLFFIIYDAVYVVSTK